MSENQCVLACVTAQKDCARLIRKGSEMARENGLPLRVMHVSQGKNIFGSPDSAAILDELFSLAHEVEAEMNIVYEQDVPAAIARCAAEWGASVLVLGPDRSGTAGRVKRLLAEGIQVVVVE
ncbi:MAG: universal stress protein [Clostridia bacterium]|nr:universal stress protein [Clostridia bacterium]